MTSKFIVLMTLAACAGGEGEGQGVGGQSPPGGNTCTSSDDCESGLDCASGGCIAAHGIGGVIGASVIGTNRGTMKVYLLPLDTLEVAACVEPIAQIDIEVNKDTVRYALDGVPSGEFLLVASFPDLTFSGDDGKLKLPVGTRDVDIFFGAGDLNFNVDGVARYGCWNQ